jgi:hypothetical protein
MKTLPLLLALAVTAAPLLAQSPGGGAPQSGANAALLKLFGNVTAFTAKSEIQMTPQPGAAPKRGAPAGPMSMTATTAVRDGSMRTEVDMTTVQGGQFPPQAMASLKNMGMDRVVTVVRKESKNLLVIYPGLKGYVEMPMDNKEAELMGLNLDIEKTETGRETVAGHETVKYRVVMKDGSKPVREMTLWAAPELKDFPVRIEMTEEGNLVRMTYTDIKLEAPDAALFKAPEGFTKHADLMALMQAGAMRMMGRPPGQ